MLYFSKITTYLTNKLQRKITQAELASVLGLDKSSISLRIKRNSFLNESHKKKIEEYYDIKLDEDEEIVLSCNDAEKFINVKFYPDVIGSCGNGVFEQSQNYETVRLPEYLINKYNPQKEYSIITAKGNSMSGTVEDGDKLLIESFSNEQIFDNKIYIFCYNDEIFIKRLCKNINQLIIKSDNKDFPLRYVEGEQLDNIQIIGKVVMSIRNYV